MGDDKKQSVTRDEQEKVAVSADSHLKAAECSSENVAAETTHRATGGSGGNAIIVSRRQTGNPLLKFLRNVRYEFGETKADYDVGSGCCIVYLSLKFHRRHPDYITTRFKEIGHSFTLQILLVLCDIEESEQRLRELNQLCLFSDWSIILAYSVEEAAEYLELYKIYEHKPADILCGSADSFEQSSGKAGASGSSKSAASTASKAAESAAAELLCCIRSVNRTDATQLLAMFGSLKRISEASVDQLHLCPGFGRQKALKVFEAFREPFVAEKGKDCDKTDLIDGSDEDDET